MIDLILLCLSTASFSLFVDMCMEEGMILHWYYKLIERLPEVLFKPLGGCIYCFSAWCFVLFYCLSDGGDKNFVLFLGIGINYIFIKSIEKYVI